MCCYAKSSSRVQFLFLSHSAIFNAHFSVILFQRATNKHTQTHSIKISMCVCVSIGNSCCLCHKKFHLFGRSSITVKPNNISGFPYNYVSVSPLLLALCFGRCGLFYIDRAVLYLYMASYYKEETKHTEKTTEFINKC